jgi:hypothetical protein
MTCILLGSSLWLYNTCDAGMPHLPLYLELHISFIRSRVKKGRLMPWWELYTLSDLRESFEELGKVFFLKKHCQKPKLLRQKKWRGFGSRPFQPSTTQGNMIDTSKVHKLRYMALNILHVDPYHKKSRSTLVLSPSLEDEQRLSVEVLLMALKYHF